MCHKQQYCKIVISEVLKMYKSQICKQWRNKITSKCLLSYARDHCICISHNISKSCILFYVRIIYILSFHKKIL